MESIRRRGIRQALWHGGPKLHGSRGKLSKSAGSSTREDRGLATSQQTIHFHRNSGFEEQGEPCPRNRGPAVKEVPMSVDTILHHAKIATNAIPSFVEALAICDGTILAVG